MVAVFSFGHAYATPQPTAAQIAAFQSLSESEKRALASQLGIELSPQVSESNSTGVNSVQTSSVLKRDSNRAAVEFDLGAQNPDSETSGDGLAASQLKPFGYDLFAGEPSTFQPLTDVPVSSDYVLGAGDVLKINLYGKNSGTFDLEVDAEGKAYLPDLGPILLSGLTLSQAKEKIVDTYNKKVIGVRVSVSMGSLRSIRVFVLGEAYLPGSYIVSSLSTITNALLLSGGVAETGSLRNIQLKRRGEIVQNFDLYDLLLNGDTRNDAQLRSGDVVFIPPLGNTVSIEGSVRRPGIYESKAADTITDIISYAGGLLPTALTSAVSVVRVGDGDNQKVLSLDLSAGAKAAFDVKSGDSIAVPSKLAIVKNSILISGSVKRPGSRKWVPGIRVSEVFTSLDLLEEDADLNYALVKHTDPVTRTISFTAFSPKVVVSDSFSPDDSTLSDQDELIFLPRDKDKREQKLSEMLKVLESQASNTMPFRHVVVNGSVNFPGTYPLSSGMTLGDLLKAAGGLSENAYELEAELHHVSFDASRKKLQSRTKIDLLKKQDLATELGPRDTLLVRQTPEFASQVILSVEGEVRFPGKYVVYKGETVLDVIERAGGLTDEAYPKGALYTRVALKEIEEIRLAELQDRLAENIAKAEIASTESNVDGPQVGELSKAQALLAELRVAQAQGRLVIDLEKMIEQQDASGLTIRHEDRLVIPPKQNSVTVIGEVQIPVSQLFEEERDYLSYINSSGGFTPDADEDRIYIIKASGLVVQPSQSHWFSGTRISRLEPGDTIVVPLDASKIDNIVLWKDLTQILYQTALGVAAIGSL